jgi:hypothetical protein
MTHEFKVVFDGIRLSKERADAIRRRIQAVILEELSQLDHEGDRNAVILGLTTGEDGNGGGGTQGVSVRAATATEATSLLASETRGPG